MKNWIEAELINAREVTEEFGQEIAFHPMQRDANRRSQWDPKRQAFSFCGVFEWPSADVAQKNSDMVISTRSPTVFARRIDLPEMPKFMDRLSLQTQGRLAVFEINEIQPDGRSGVIFILNQVGTQF